MIVTLDIKPEIKRGLRVQAQARGVSLNELLQDVMREITGSAQEETANASGTADRAAKPFWEMILDSMKDVPQEVLDRLPRDGAAEHDHCIYGTPKKYS